MLAITPEEMRRLEGACADRLDTLMQTAGTNAAAEFLEHALRTLPPRHRRRFVVIAGKGNNGGDALCVAKYLHAHGQDVCVHSTCPLADYSGTAASQSLDFPDEIPYHIVNERVTDNELKLGDVIIDGLLGIGLKGNARGVCAAIIDQINASGLPAYSIDCPSGLDCNSGMGSPVVRSDFTVTMAFPKIGFFMNEGPKRIGRLQVIPIGLPKDIEQSVRGVLEVFTSTDAAAILSRRPPDSHKNTFGHCLCVAGSRRYSGAPFLAAEASMRSGAGLVTLAVPGMAYPRQASASIMVSQIGNDAQFSSEDILEMQLLAQRSTAILYGPGTGAEVPSSFLEAILELDQPTVIDADGIWLLAKSPKCIGLLKQRRNAVILTPHPGEMSALIHGLGLDSLVQTSRQEQASKVSMYCNAFVLLKGQHSVAAAPDGRISINTSGSPALATAGTGDVLAGIMAALLAQNHSAWNALRLAAFVHGMAAELYPHATLSMTADDLLQLIPKAFRHISPLA
ncbi:MAG: NAD(P)H-hydrate dehydratase [Victivallales bacterium]|nr:NAD(P)H-hydrate dehydratase [Victivallales bacterium]